MTHHGYSHHGQDEVLFGIAPCPRIVIDGNMLDVDNTLGRWSRIFSLLVLFWLLMLDFLGIMVKMCMVWWMRLDRPDMRQGARKPASPPRQWLAWIVKVVRPCGSHDLCTGCYSTGIRCGVLDVDDNGIAPLRWAYMYMTSVLLELHII